MKQENFDEEKYKGQCYILQEYVSGTNVVDYVGNFYVEKGKILTSLYYRDIYTKPSKYYIICGRLVYKEICEMEQYNSIFENIFILSNYNGFACVDFKLIDDKIKIMEINPRLGGSLTHDDERFYPFIIKTIEKLNQ